MCRLVVRKEPREGLSLNHQNMFLQIDHRVNTNHKSFCHKKNSSAIHEKSFFGGLKLGIFPMRILRIDHCVLVSPHSLPPTMLMHFLFGGFHFQHSKSPNYWALIAFNIGKGQQQAAAPASQILGSTSTLLPLLELEGYMYTFGYTFEVFLKIMIKFPLLLTT